MKRLIAPVAALLSLVPAAAFAQDVAITNVTLATGDGGDPVEGATVVVRGGKVVAAGVGVTAPAGTTTIDGTGRWVAPGFFAAYTNLGLMDVDAVEDSNDSQANGSPFSAALDVAPAINPAAQNIAVSRAGGVTRAAVGGSPARSIFAGQGALIDLGADANAVTRPRAFQVVALGETGARIAGGSRVSAHALLRNALREAGQFGDDARIIGSAEPAPLETGDDLPIDPRFATGDTERGTDVLLTRFDAAALVPVVRGQQKLFVLVERAADIRSVIALKREFPRLDLVLVGASEGWLVAADIAASGIPVLADGLDDLPNSFEELAATQSNIGRMVAAGVKVGISARSLEQPRWLAQYAGNLVGLTRVPGASGLTWGQAMAAITSIPAQIAGAGDRYGVLAAGAQGDLVLWDGDPFEVTSAPLRVWIDGVEQPLDSHQSRLRDRYRDLDESELPKAYDW